MAKKKKASTKKISHWPQKRNVLFRPQRLEYISNQKTRAGEKESCVFCESLSKKTGAESLLIAKTRRAMVVLNKYPYNPGHVMVLPQRHIGDILQIEKEEYAEVMELVRVSVAALTQTFSAKDFNVGINLGRIAGAGLPSHLHVHIVPRWSGDLNFFPLIGETKVISSDLPAIFSKLQPVFKDLIAHSKDFK